MLHAAAIHKAGPGSNEVVMPSLVRRWIKSIHTACKRLMAVCISITRVQWYLFEAYGRKGEGYKMRRMMSH